jgi:ubiquinone/menaquinone biosynthesis C-methylase UbiE
MTGIDITDRLFPKNSEYGNIFFTKGTVLSLPSAWSSTFTFVHQRLLIAALQKSEWSVALSEIYRSLKPNGWVQITEIDRLEGGPKTQTLQRTKKAMYEKVGLLPDCVEHIPRLLREAGFTYVEESGMTERVIPLGNWEGKIGQMAKKNFSKIYRSLKDAFARHGWTREEIDQMMDETEAEWEERRDCAIRICTFVARKSEQARR